MCQKFSKAYEINLKLYLFSNYDDVCLFVVKE